ncbi:ABC transporter ATP-binding protein [Pusillimonas sp. DMV24BSW_D]|uniref:ABC transporter ATP-binding protein n=1 Tax=Neopusillimonas aestuarii TaxID=2716226 RepID=UPI00140C79B7|nr:ABC transporter ATP-binding protein [Pusillimonas sp. DMV24BSW_D]QIM50077.1 ABC transporter ATP-binding protein [Pusillimonas sp. DMV24BSW_D]
MSNTSQDILTVDRVCAGYGEAVVLEDISFSLKEGGSLALLGRNGVGKSTLLLTLLGLTQLHSGSIHWDGRDVSRVPTHQRAAAGMGWVPQERHMYPSLTVEEHLTVVARPGQWDVAKVYKLFPRLEERRANMGNQLSGGEQQMLAIARALMVNPRLLLLDEPMEGLAPIIVQELLGVIRRLVHETGLTVIVVEQHARLALGLTQDAIVLDRGQIVHQSTSQSLLDEPETLNRLVAVA